jgi:hypothetical protein
MKIMKVRKTLQLIILAGAVLLLGTRPAAADPLTLTLDTSVLAGGTYTAVFELIDQDGAVDNSVALDFFHFGGGGALGSPDYMGTTGVSGDLTSGISLDDSGGFALFTQQFTAGSQLSFVVQATDNLAPGAVGPDSFAFALCDVTFSTCYSDDASGALATANLNGGTLQTTDFATFGDSSIGLAAPVAAVPEPSSLLLLLPAIAGLAGITRRKLSR